MTSVIFAGIPNFEDTKKHVTVYLNEDRRLCIAIDSDLLLADLHVGPVAWWTRNGA